MSCCSNSTSDFPAGGPAGALLENTMLKKISRAILPAICMALAACTTTNQPVPVQPGATGQTPPEARQPVTILVSIDGFRPDYLQRGITPNLNALAESGISAAMRPSFPTKTFPNHYTLVTGLRPDRHGVVGNTMRDAARPGEVFTMTNKDIFWWQQAEPIWITAEKQGVRSATMFWPGSEVAFSGTRPANWWPFSMDLSNDRRVEAVLDWMRRPAETRPKLVTLYFDTVDTAGHFFGPAPSEKLHAAIADADTQIGTLKSALDKIGQPANLVIISDHGMAETHPDRVIYMDSILPRDKYVLITDGTYAGIDPLNGDMDSIRAAFVRPHAHMQCWEKGDIPARLEYGKNLRVPAIICLPETGWKIYQDKPEWMTGIGGDHGYDNAHPDMAALFIASGPGIAAKGEIGTFDNVDIYPLVARLAGITPNANQGSLNSFDGALAAE